MTGDGSQTTYAPPDQPGARGSSFPIRPRARRFNALYPEATGAVSAASDGLGPAGGVVGASDEGHIRLTTSLPTTRLLDITPTLAYLLELPVADDLPGDVISAAFAAEHLAAKPIRRVPSWTHP